MSNAKKAKGSPVPQGLNRIPAEEFIEKLNTAESWMVWVNPAFEEVELVVMDGEIPSVYHGPDPMSMDFAAYKDFCRQVDIVSDVKDGANDGLMGKDEVVKKITETKER